MHYDGQNLYVASLGDAREGSSTIFQGDIPSDDYGEASGSTGGFFNIIGNRNQNLFVYQKKASKGGHYGFASTNIVNELVVLKLDSQLNYISITTLLSGDVASRVNSIKSVPYVIPSTELKNFNRQESNYKVYQAYIILLSGVDGSFLVQLTLLSTFQINSFDYQKILENGSIAYPYIDNSNNLNIYYTPSLTIPSYPNSILPYDRQHIQFWQLYSNYLIIIF